MIPRVLHDVRDLNHDGNLLEQMLHICALGSGCLAHYIGHLTEQLQRQNMVRLENIKLRKELDASLETVSDSREHIAELKRLVGPQVASSSERRVLDELFMEQRLPRLVLAHRIEISELQCVSRCHSIPRDDLRVAASPCLLFLCLLSC